MQGTRFLGTLSMAEAFLEVGGSFQAILEAIKTWGAKLFTLKR